MAALEDFENTLNEVVNAKRLSASKMNKLTEIAIKSLENDTKLVAILYRTHKSLPNSAKVSSLYAFDALARAARSLVNKHGITGDINSGRGNAATFLLKIEGVLDGLFQDMGSLNNSEIKEKTKKVLDIWVKSNTFPSPVLTRLRDILSDVRKENAVNPTIPVDPRAGFEAPPMITTSPSAPHTPTAPGSNVQATLLALLGQAAQTTSNGEPPGQTTANTDPRVQQVHLALLQQLALTAKLANNSPTPPPGQTPPPADATVIPPPEPSLPPSRPQQVGRFNPPGEARYGRSGHLDRGGVRDQRDLRGRGGARGGYRGGRGRWDDHHSQDRFRHRDRDWEPSSRSRPSRSRSPRRQEERRNVRTYSPPRRPSIDKEMHRRPELTMTPGTDEFGRDIRASSNSPFRTGSDENTEVLAPKESSIDPNPGAPADYHIPVSDQSALVAASTSAQSTETHASDPSSASQQQPGLDQFDIGTFDATASSSWEALGNMWKTSRGYLPSQEELMHFVMTGSMAAAGVANGEFGGAQGGQCQQQGNWDEQVQEPRHNLNNNSGRYYGDGYGGESSSSYAVALDGGADNQPIRDAEEEF